MLACFDTAENESCKVCPLSAYRSPRLSRKSLRSSLKSFHRKGKLQEAALALIAKDLPESKVFDLQSALESLDPAKRGVVTLGQVKEILQGLGMKDQVRKSMIGELDPEESAQLVKYSEFVAKTMDRKDHRKEAYVWEVFTRLDVGSTGRISKDDLAAILSPGALRTPVNNFE